MRTKKEFAFVKQLAISGHNDCQISRITGIPRSTIRDWRIKARAKPAISQTDCPICENAEFDCFSYAYLLGLYLGDGWISRHPRGVFRLRIALDKVQLLDSLIGPKS